MTASVDIKTDHKSNVVAVPIASVITRDPFENGTGFDSEESKKLSNKEGKASKSVDTTKESAQKSPKSVDGSLATNRVKTWVFILENGKAKAVEVTTGIQNLDYFEILSGVKEGQTIITGPSMVIAKTLNHDDPVQVQKLK